MSHEDFSPELPVPPARERPVGPGIMVFSSSAKVLYTNAAAQQFLQRLSREEQGRSSDGALPAAVTQLIDQMKQPLECRFLDKDSGHLKAAQSVVAQDQPLLLRVFGLADRWEPPRSRMVITMEEIPTSVAANSGETLRLSVSGTPRRGRQTQS